MKEKRRLIGKAAVIVYNRLLPKEVHLQYEEDDRENDENCQADPGPFFHFFFDGFTFVFAEERFARTAESIDTGRVARLQQDKYDSRKRSESHKHDHSNTKRAVRVVCSTTLG